MGGWNTKSVMPPKLIVVPLRSGHTSISLLYHYYTTNTTTIPQISLLYHSIHSTVLCAGRLFHAADRCERTARDCSAIARWRPHYPFSRKTLAQRYARWPRRISLRDGAQRDRAYAATGGLHTFARTRQRRRGCAQSRRA